MKKLFKILGIILLLFLVVVIAVPYLFKDKIFAIVKDEVNANLNAVVDFGDFDLSLISEFPDFSFNIEDVSITGLAQFDSLKLAQMDRLNFKLDLASVISGDEYKVKKILIDGLDFNALVLEDGTANYEILKEDFDSDTSEVKEDAYPYKVLLEDYQITNSSITYDNKSLGVLIDINELNHLGSGQLSDEFYQLTTKTSAGECDITYEGIDYLRNADTEIDAKFNISDEFRQYDLLENDIRVNDLKLKADGEIYMPEDGFDIDIKYQTTETNLKTILSLIPLEYMSDLSGVETNGEVNLNGTVKGKYDDNNLPGFTVETDIKNGYLKYPDLPESVQDIQLKGGLDFPGGSDFNSMTINISKFHMNLADNPIDANLLLKNTLTDPYIKSAIKSQLDFGTIKDAIPIDQHDQLSGILTADIDLEGNYSEIENENYESFKADGTAILQDFSYSSDSLSFDTDVQYAHLNFSPKHLELSKFESKVGKTEIDASGKIDNYLGWFLKNEVLSGRFDVKTGYLDLADFMETGEESPDGVEEEPLSVIEVPGNIDFLINASMDGMKYDNVDMRNVAGQIKVKDKKAEMNDVRMDLLGGSVVVNGAYNTSNPEAPKIDFSYDIEQMAIKESAETFNTVNMLAPIAKHCVGKFNSAMNFSSTLNQNMEPLYETITGDGNAFTSQVFVQNFKPVTKIAETLKMDQFGQQALKNVKMRFEFNDGKVFVKPFDIVIDKMDAVMSGNMAFDGQMDYDMKLKVPSNKLGNVSDFMSNVLGSVNALGTNMSVGEYINVDLKITGTIDDPKIKPVFGGSEGQSVQDVVEEKVKEVIQEELVEPAKETAREEADKLIAKAQEQADKIMAEANKLADQVRSEGETQAQKIEDEAKNPFAKAAAKLAADKVRNEANKKADNIVNEAQKRADEIMAKARKEADAKLQ